MCYMPSYMGPFSKLEEPLGPPSIDVSQGTVTVYTDGAALRRTGSFCGGYGAHFPSLPMLDLYGPLLGPLQSAQRAELRAVCKALELSPARLRVVSDRSYVV